ncbi:unnamed protein product [Vitrella brassicaformis CCMP3155]|uniref:Uncharacterized protein n=1 Tax=Vitrella brassicaformis (strain CCMP3155) TaxID=1169540 RepID=A0A0G4FZA5_VITBC|nr:unnamed protein product [Vitrella brassicaformis CCMP3155]|eukprot:CEM20499.1 unnamed protein product [Vitrella brassicaformis CCMP3155]
MEDGRQVKRSRFRTDAPAASSSAAAAASGGGGGGGGGGESDEERQRGAERDRRFWGNAPLGLLSIVMAFLPIHLLMQLQLPPLTWQLTARKQHHFTISAADKDERSFWQRTTIDLVKEWATYLRKLTCVVLHCPIGFPRWCFDVFVAVIEGHIAGRRAANLTGGTLHTIAIKERVRLTGAAGQAVARTYPPLPARLNPPPTLDALETIAGLCGGHWQLAYRRWVMPSLATVQQHEAWGADSLGQFISSSRSLRSVDSASFRGEGWASVFEGIPAAGVGQQGGPLAQLESIGTIVLEDENHRARAGIERLQEVLVSRGCRQSLKQLHVEFGPFYRIDRRMLPVLLALDRLVGTCCRPDAPLTLTATSNFGFDLAIFYCTDFPTHPSPSFKTMLKQLAQQATSVKYIFTQDGLADPHTTPIQSAIELASTLSFDKTETVEVKDFGDFHPTANAPSPHPAIISHLQPFPKASELNFETSLGGTAGQLLASKMPKELGRVNIYEVSGAEEKVGMLAALGREREVGTVWMGDIGVDQLEGAADELPTIGRLHFALTLPAGVQDAGSFVRTGLSSVTPHIRGLQRVILTVDTTTAEQHDFIEAFVPVGTNIEGFTIICISRVFWGGTQVEIAAPSDA